MDVINKQLAIIERIVKIRERFIKDGPTKRVKKGLVYYEDSLQALDDAWQDFDEQDSELRKSLPQTHEYFTSHTYDNGNDTYEKVKRTIQNAMIADFQREAPHSEDPLPGSSRDSNLIQPLPNSKSETPRDDQPLLDRPRPSNMNLKERLRQLLESMDDGEIENHNDTFSRPSHLPKLPPIKLPRFSGKESEWQNFIELFTSVIHDNPSLNGVQKMQYLISSLEGTPKQMVSQMTLTNANYVSCLDILKSRYENKRLMVNNYMSSIVQHKRIATSSAEDVIHLHDCINACVAGLKNLGYNVTTWDPMLVSIAMQKFDGETNKAFEESIIDVTAVPTIAELMKFLLKRYRILRASPKEAQHSKELKKKSFHTASSSQATCSKCGNDHILMKCPEFQKLTPLQRKDHAKEKNLCYNCLAHHRKDDCKSKKTCFTCNKRHHTLLHFEQKKPTDKKSLHTSVPNESDAESTEDAPVAFHTKTSSVVLPTAEIRIRDKAGQWQHFRALLDTGSGDTFVSESAAQTLKLPRQKTATSIKGIGDVKAAVSKTTMDITIAPRFSSQLKWCTIALVLPKLSSFLPSRPIRSEFALHNDEGIILADPKFDTPGLIDVIIGTELYAQLVKTNLKRDKSGLVAQDTELGWIILGNTLNPGKQTQTISMISLVEIERSLKKFWEMDVEDNTPAEQHSECETHFKETHSRQPDGRYQVRLPFKRDSDLELGESRRQALARFISMEKKFSSDPQLKQAYEDFITEYQELGHMSPVENYIGPAKNVYYLPHHAVFKESSTTTKVRVVFDASAKTDSGASLNTLLHTGPRLQQDLTAVLTRWRKYRYVFTADIEKMFRQISLHEDDRNFHRILWRNTSREPIQEYQLNTVTYGTGPATYLSVRTLLQLADDEGQNFPRAAKAIREDFYVDDMLTGAYSEGEARQLYHEITELMKRGKFNIRKWTSNYVELLESIPDDMREKGIIQLKEDETIVPLGIHLNPSKDTFQFSIKMREKAILTKRGITSESASIFDPIGWLAPILLQSKIIIQMLWKEEIGWDDKPCEILIKRWLKFRTDILDIENIRIPRWIHYASGSRVEIHGFADASEKAFAACIYTRTTTGVSTWVHLLCAKTRVAPQKGKITLPRLELCAAVLLAKLMKSTIESLDINIDAIYAWSDSEITLAWIKKDPSTWTTYVANRVSKIHQTLPKDVWHHVKSADNPADIASRGTTAELLRESALWWRGPNWLSKPHEAWPAKRNDHAEKFEQELLKTTKCHFTLGMFTTLEHAQEAFSSVAHIDDKNDTFLRKFSTFNKLIIVIALLLRFITNSKLKSEDKQSGHLTTAERQKAKKQIYRLIQQRHFPEEINALKRNSPLPTKSKIKDLHPFLDDDGVLRVGGRIHNSLLPVRTKNPILLPKCHTTDTIIREVHEKMLHAGPQLTLNQLRTQFWVVKGVSYVKTVVHKCVRCARCAPKSANQLMGDLPASRVTPAPPFARCGVDYAGPIITRRNKGRGNINEKSYVAIFVCLVTKAMHIEAVSDLSTESFMAALQRFISRRGKPAIIMSDNGTNFVGAKRTLDKEVAQAVKRASKSVANTLAHEGIQWKFIPPGTPHFGGLWEAAVKSVKHHLIRVIGLTKLTFEELSTLLTRIEACVNSRPLAPISNDPNDLEALTPGHFLIGRELTAPPERDELEATPTNRWRQITKIQQQLWKRWSQEYLSTLQQRTKWRDQTSNPEIGDLVLLREDNSPPLKWPMARITELHPGKDGLVRVATIRLKNQKLKQAPIHKLIQLPIETTNESVGPLPASTSTPDVDDAAPPQQQQTSPSTSSVTKRPQTRSVTRSALITMLYFMTLFTTIFASNFTLTKLEPGIFIEKLGEFHLSRGKLRMELLLPRTTFNAERSQIVKVWNQSRTLCEETKKMVSHTQCEILMRHLEHERNTCLNNLDEIDELTQLAFTRKRRGLLGKVMKFMFGSDEDDVYTHLDALGHNHNALLQTMNQQTLLLNTRITQSNEITQEKLRTFNDRAEQLTRAIEDMKPWDASIDRNRLELHMLTTYLGASGYLQELRSKHEAIIRVLTNKGTGVELLSRSETNSRIEAAHKKLGASLMISKQIQESTRFRATQDAILVYVYFHIIETTSYELIHTTPIPQHLYNATYAIQDIKDSLTGADYHNQRYFIMQDTDLERCQEVQQGERICEVDIVYDMAAHPSCILDEVFNKHEGKECPTKKVQVRDVLWKRLNTENTWFFMTQKPTMIAIMCGGYREETVLNTSGILHVKRDCFVKTETLTLRASIAMDLQAVSIFNRPLPFPEINSTQFKLEQPITLNSSSIIKKSEDIFAKVATPVPAVVPLELLPIPRHTPYTISGVLGSIIIIIILWITKDLWWKPLRHRCSRNRNVNAGPQSTCHTPLAERLQRIIGDKSTDAAAGPQDVQDEHALKVV